MLAYVSVITTVSFIIKEVDQSILKARDATSDNFSSEYILISFNQIFYNPKQVLQKMELLFLVYFIDRGDKTTNRKGFISTITRHRNCSRREGNFSTRRHCISYLNRRKNCRTRYSRPRKPFRRNRAATKKSR